MGSAHVLTSYFPSMPTHARFAAALATVALLARTAPAQPASPITATIDAAAKGAPIDP